MAQATLAVLDFVFMTRLALAMARLGRDFQGSVWPMIRSGVA